MAWYDGCLIIFLSFGLGCILNIISTQLPQFLLGLPLLGRHELHPYEKIFPFVFTACCLFWFWHFGFDWHALGACIFTAFLGPLFLIDLKYLILPDQLTFPLLWIGLLFNLHGVFSNIDSAIIGVIAGYLTLFFIYHIFLWLSGKQGLGHGDFKLLAALLAWTGVEFLGWILLLAGILTLGVFGLKKIFQENFNPQIPFGPGLALAGIIILAFGNNLNTLTILISTALFGG